MMPSHGLLRPPVFRRPDFCFLPVQAHSVGHAPASCASTSAACCSSGCPAVTSLAGCWVSVFTWLAGCWVSAPALAAGGALCDVLPAPKPAAAAFSWSVSAVPLWIGASGFTSPDGFYSR